MEKRNEGCSHNEPNKNQRTFESQRKKDEDLIGKSSGDTNYEGGSNNNLKDLNRDNHADNNQITEKSSKTSNKNKETTIN